jgi:murein L,D-transpeptidase YafK
MKTSSLISFSILCALALHSISTHANEFAFCDHLDSIQGSFYADLSKVNVSASDGITSILVRKDIRRLFLLSDKRIIKSYNIALGKQPVGHKVKQGDFKTPEGIYTITEKKRDSGYHRALKINYPNHRDVARARKLGVNPGGDVYLHGLSNHPARRRELMSGEHPVINWTWGCIAVTNEEIDEIFAVVKSGTPIEICPMSKK